ncbi:MAG: hypothetical protein V3T53_09315 [Phycisphaerales bacterium]
MTGTWKGMRDSRRVVLLLALSVVGMAILGTAAMATQYAKDGWLIRWQHPRGALAGLGFSFVLGAVAGLLTAPVVVPGLFQKRLLVAVPAVYGSSLAVVVLFTLVTDIGNWEPLATAGIAIVSVCVGSIGGQALLPDAPSDEKRCPSCGYDLRGAEHKVCPECGVPTG